MDIDTMMEEKIFSFLLQNPAHRSLQVLAIFPKRFELEGFLSSLRKKESFLIRYNEDEKRECFVVHYKFPDSVAYLKILCYVINSSDIEFSFDLGKLLDEARKNQLIATEDGEEQNKKSARKTTTQLFVFLIGTAGSSNKEHKLGQAFHVTTAVKVDRGKITYDEDKNNLIMEGTKKSFSNSRPNLGCATTICTNYVAHCKSENLFSSTKKNAFEKCDTETAADSYLMDMETFEFFKTCELNDVDCYQCFRMVSDVFIGNDFVKISDKTRKCVNFDVLRDIFFDYLRASMGHVSMSSENQKWNLLGNTYLSTHHDFLIERINRSRKEKVSKILTTKEIADKVNEYASTVGIAEGTGLFELVEELRKL